MGAMLPYFPAAGSQLAARDTSLTNRAGRSPIMPAVDRLALIGVSHRRGGAEALERWQAAFPRARDVAALGFTEAVLLITCNRWEALLALPHPSALEEARRRLAPPGAPRRPYAFSGEAAVEQLARVTASLDSLNPGEDQIMRQVREAYSEAQAEGTAGPLTSFACQAALRAAKRVRREVHLAPLNTSLFSLALPLLREQLIPGAPAAVIGAGEMAGLAARALSGSGVRPLVVNRSAERAEALAREVGGTALPLREFLEHPPAVRVLVCATPRKDLVDEELLDRLPDLEVIVDLGVPRNVQAAAAAARNLRVLDVDTLQAAGERRRVELTQRLAEAERVLGQELARTLDEWTDRQLAPAITRLRELYRETVGADLPPEEAERLAHRFAHVPIKGLRALAREHGLAAAQTFLAEAGLL